MKALLLKLLTSIEQLCNRGSADLIKNAGITKTWLSNESNFNIKHFETVRKDRRLRRGGGVAICLRKGIKYTYLDNLYDCDGELETCGVRLYAGSGDISLVSCYRPASGRLIPISNWTKFFN
ncbi:PREDICTED: uncharacterized protein LOC106741163 [Dinoponera quadriceps]|uniref:Uncharacterized protein LOC106741163 n=1 Tax=Dinoponera quadriceps TaxID=609295 RepID=A0A6P3WQQ4_DINQU|nr:PREDICTED: uncharacterized protein LOC106741163 [Dinoponera quadriceps]